MAGRPHRVAGELRNGDTVMNQTFWIGVYPGLGGSAIAQTVETIRAFIRR